MTNKDIEKMKSNIDELVENLKLKQEKIQDLAGANMQLQIERNELRQAVDDLRERISSLESELSVKENLLKIKNGLCKSQMMTVVVAKTINGQDYVRLEDFMSVVNDLQNYDLYHAE